MNSNNLKDLIPTNFSDASRVWIYQSNRPFREKEELEINEQLYQFYAQWQAHGAPVKGWAKVLYNQFIIIMADETDVDVSGCSTDSSVRVIKSLEKQYHIDLFDRLTITFLHKDKAEMLPFGQVQYAVDKGYIDKNTMLFNNVITTKKELLENWMVPLHKSWLANRISFTEATGS